MGLKQPSCRGGEGESPAWGHETTEIQLPEGRKNGEQKSTDPNLLARGEESEGGTQAKENMRGK